ncbi:MAG: hypothetical protein INF04_04140 [Phenylobacterium sp.]|nr:hypothetical protein [Phenylobacterium sp.]MCA6238300.1 hypothetical protein [Phenylobacterium sp.]
MPMLGKAGKSARNFLNSDAGQALLSTLSIFVPGDPYGFVQSRKARQEKDARQQTMLSSFNDLIGQIQPPDTYTPQVNQLIGAANETGGRFGMAPMQRQTPRPSGLDLQDPRTREALMSFISAGGNVDAPFALADRIAPPAPNMSLFNTRSGVVGINPQTGETQELYSDPYAEALAQRQIDAQGALADQRRAGGQAALIRANRPPASGGGGGEAPAGPVATGRRF